MKTLFLIALLPAVAGAEPIELAKCPPAVKATIEQNSRGGVVEEVDSHSIGGQTLYVAEVELAGDLDLKIHVATDGALVKTREDVPVASLPEAVRKTVETRLAGGKTDDVEKEVAGSETRYHVEIEKVGAKDVHLVIDPEGKVVRESAGDDD